MPTGTPQMARCNDEKTRHVLHILRHLKRGYQTNGLTDIESNRRFSRRKQRGGSPERGEARSFGRRREPQGDQPLGGGRQVQGRGNEARRR